MKNPLIRQNIENGGSKIGAYMTQEIPEIGFVRLPQVLSVIPYKKSTWWAGVRSGRFPKPLKLSIRCTVWKAEDIRNLIKELGEKSPQDN